MKSWVLILIICFSQIVALSRASAADCVTPEIQDAFDAYMIANCSSLFDGVCENGETATIEELISDGQGYFPTDSQVLTDRESLAVFAYTSALYSDLNKRLRVNPKSDAIFTRVLNCALNKLPDYADYTTRYDSVPARVLATWKVGKIVTDNAYLSSTSKRELCHTPVDDADPGFCTGYHQHFNILSAHGKPVSDYSGFKDENEILFKTGTRFLVKKRVRLKSGIEDITLVEVGR